MSGPYTFEVVNKHSPNFLARIGKRELTMLVHMLEDLEHSATEYTKEAYGYHADHQQWDEAKLAGYKSGILNARMTEKGYTFFLLQDAQGELIALASGNAGEDKSQLRLLNVTVAREHQGQGHVKELIKRVSDFAAEKGYQNIVIPLSQHARAKDHVAMYQHVAEELGIEFPADVKEQRGERPHPDDKESVELVLTPKRFLALESDRTDGKGWADSLGDRNEASPAESFVSKISNFIDKRDEVVFPGIFSRKTRWQRIGHYAGKLLGSESEAAGHIREAHMQWISIPKQTLELATTAHDPVIYDTLADRKEIKDAYLADNKNDALTIARIDDIIGTARYNASILLKANKDSLARRLLQMAYLDVGASSYETAMRFAQEDIRGLKEMQINDDMIAKLSDHSRKWAAFANQTNHVTERGLG